MSLWIEVEISKIRRLRIIVGRSKLFIRLIHDVALDRPLLYGSTGPEASIACRKISIGVVVMVVAARLMSHVQ